jgi:AraC-like DNA-binding protein
MNKKLFPVITESDKKLPYYLLGVGCHWNQEHIVCPNGYFYQWIQCVKGEGELITSGKTFRVNEGTGMLLFKGVPHEYYAITPTWIVDWIVFDGNEVEHFLKDIAGFKTSGALYVSKPDILTSRILNAVDIEQSESTLKSIKCSSIIYSLLTDIVQFASITPNDSTLNQHFKLKPLFDYIDENYNKPLTLEAMAAVMGVTPQHLCTLFKKITYIRIFQYVNSFRIQKSKELLVQNPHMQIKEISLSVGFDDVIYFCSVFKKLEKISPGEFRKIYNY